MARAKGLRTWRIKKMYVNRNARLPIATSVALAFGSIVGGAFLVEVVFSYPGIGYMLYEAGGLVEKVIQSSPRLR